MSQKNDIPVVINNKVYTLSGFESEEYLQKVAAYINNKLAEFNKDESYVSLPKVTAVLMQNIRVYYLHLISQMITSKRSFR